MIDICYDSLLKALKENSNLVASDIYYLDGLGGYTSKVLLDRGIYKVGKLCDLIALIASELYKIEDLGEYYPFYLNGVKTVVKDFEELLRYVIYDFETIELGDSKYYSPNEIKIVEVIKRYQMEVGAELEILKEKRGITKEDVESYSHKKIRYILNKKVRKNKGIFYVPSLMGYTSTHLYVNYEREKGGRKNGGCNYKRLRKFGELKEVVPETLRSHDKTKVRFYYPYRIKGNKSYSEDTEGLYRVILNSPDDFQLVYERQYYSRQIKRNIKYLLKYIRQSKGGTNLE